MRHLLLTTLLALTLAQPAHANLAEYCSVPSMRHNTPSQAQYEAINTVLKKAFDDRRYYQTGGNDLTNTVVQGSKDFVVPLITCDLTVDKAMNTIAAMPPVYLMELNLAIEAVEAGIASAQY